MHAVNRFTALACLAAAGLGVVKECLVSPPPPLRTAQHAGQFQFTTVDVTSTSGDGSSSREGVDESSAFCRAESLTSSSKVQQDAYTEAWLDIGNYVCGSQAEEPMVFNIEAQSEAVAIAIAEAFAEVSINCKAAGNADVRATAYALSTQRAEAVGSAITGILAGNEVCEQCTAAVAALSALSKTIVAEAVAEAWTEVYIFADDGTEVPESSTVTSHVIVETIADVLSSIAGAIRTGADGDCSIEIINEAKVGDYIASCELAASGDITEISIDAIASAGAEASAYACNGDTTDVTVDTIARSTAEAVAQAMASADVYCFSNGGQDSLACGLAAVDVRAVASAQAEAFAVAIATAETCDCLVLATGVVETFAEIWVEAAANAYAETCVLGSGEDFVGDFQFAFEDRTVEATARAIATAVADARQVDGSQCFGTIGACASTSEQCVERDGQCGGLGLADVLPCCDDAYRCFRRNSRDFRCRHRNARLPSFWDGTVAECSLGGGSPEYGDDHYSVA